MKLKITHKEMRSFIVASFGRGLPLQNIFASVDLSLSLSYECKPKNHFISVLAYIDKDIIKYRLV